MFLTYCAVVATDSSMIVREVGKTMRSRARAVSVAVIPDSGVFPAARPASASALPRERPGPLTLILGIAALTAFAFAAPIVIGIASPIHLLIAGFALYEAWKLNKGDRKSTRLNSSHLVISYAVFCLKKKKKMKKP